MYLDLCLPNKKVYRNIPLDSVYRTIKKGTLPATTKARLSGSVDEPWLPVSDFLNLDLPKPEIKPTSLAPVTRKDQPPPIPEHEEEEVLILEEKRKGPSILDQLAATNLRHQPFPVIVDPIDYEEDPVWIRPHKKKKFFKRWTKKEKANVSRNDRNDENSNQRTGCAPAILEFLLTVFTGGCLGGVGVMIAGKGPSSFLVSLLCFIGFWMFNGVTLGLLFIATLPLYFIFVFIKLIIDVSSCLS